MLVNVLRSTFSDLGLKGYNINCAVREDIYRANVDGEGYADGPDQPIMSGNRLWMRRIQG